MSSHKIRNRSVNMRRINVLRKSGSEAKIAFIAYLAGTYLLDLDDIKANYPPEHYYMFESVLSETSSVQLLCGNLNSYRAIQILRILETSVDNKKLKFLKECQHSSNIMTAKQVMKIVKFDRYNYMLLLHIFIYHYQYKAIHEFKIEIAREFNLSHIVLVPYTIDVRIPDNIKPLIETRDFLQQYPNWPEF